MKNKLLAMALSIPLIFSMASFASAINASAANENSNTTINNPINSKDTNSSWDRITNFPDENGELRFWMDDLEIDKLSSISLTYFGNDSKPISGAQVSAYKIATLSVKNGDAVYTIVDELKKDYSKIDFNGMSSEELDKLASELVEKDIKESANTTTDDNGSCKLIDLEPGLYLIREKAKLGLATEYEEFKPFILNAPFPEIENTKYTGKWMYDVEAIPKTELTSNKKILIIPPHPSSTPVPNPPQTGDTTDLRVINFAIIVFFISLIGTTIVVRELVNDTKKRKNKT